MRGTSVRIIALSVCLWLGACGPAGGSGGDDGPGGCRGRCTAEGWQACNSDGTHADPVACVGQEVCVPDRGCLPCFPDQPYCAGPEGDEVWICNSEGTDGTFDHMCEPDEECKNGTCLTACERAAEERSNIGCEYWAVDLDNEYSQLNDAAGEPFAVAIANTSDVTVDVLIQQNDGKYGEAHQLSTVTQTQIAPFSLEVIQLPTREVDGSLMGMDEGPGTWVSSRAYRISTSYPVVAYQFNPIIQSFSNGASLLIPTSGLDDHYWVLGWPTANPIAPVPFPGIPDHSFVTIVGVTQSPVRVSVRLGSDILGWGPIPAAKKGETVELDVKAFDVLNLETTGIPGDMTGTEVTATGPVAVFTGGERAIVPVDVMPPPPSGWDGDLCCTEHFEQQQFPVTSLGKQFVTTRSPVRSRSSSNPEGDVWRVLATKPGTVINTNLPPPFDTHTIANPGEYWELWSISDFVLDASEPVIVGQYLVSQQYVENPDVGGDPEFILYPPLEQYRKDYIFLTPATFDRDWCVISAPTDAFVELDGMDVGGEINPLCERWPAGDIAGKSYIAIRCRLEDGVHRITASEPVGVTVYGYYNVGSYGYAAGSDLKRINIE